MVLHRWMGVFRGVITGGGGVGEVVCCMCFEMCKIVCNVLLGLVENMKDRVVCFFYLNL